MRATHRQTAGAQISEEYISWKKALRRKLTNKNFTDRAARQPGSQPAHPQKQPRNDGLCN